MLYLILSAVADADNSGGTASPVASAAIVIIIVVIVLLVRRSKAKKAAVSAANLSAWLEQEGAAVAFYAEQIRRGTLPEASGSPVVLKSGERVHFVAEAVRFITKNRVVGRTASTAGASFRVAKGVTFRTGGIKGKSIYGDVTSSYNGKLTVTNKRIVFTDEQKPFEVGLGSISAIDYDENGRTVIQTAKGTYVMLPAVLIDGDNAHVLLSDATEVLTSLLSLVASSGV
ncbi:MAG: hypothetical protein LBM98_01030 [Oscillospiraceae bacterium]|nr:hypothetical protein [Oscillospiraceae bacterium]